MKLFNRIKKSNIAENCSIGKFSTVIGCTIGNYSYVGDACKFFGCSIGKFCSIGSGVKLIFGNHPTKGFVSTSPYFYSTQVPVGKSFIKEQKYKEYKFVDTECQFRVRIGNDVWIGNNTLIMEGVKIGDGAIIAAGSIVVKDVEPYEIVGGNPAHHIRYRFSKEEIKWLLDLKWWNRKDEWIQGHADYFEDIQILMEIIKDE